MYINIYIFCNNLLFHLLLECNFYEGKKKQKHKLCIPTRHKIIL